MKLILIILFIGVMGMGCKYEKEPGNEFISGKDTAYISCDGNTTLKFIGSETGYDSKNNAFYVKFLNSFKIHDTIKIHDTVFSMDRITAERIFTNGYLNGALDGMRGKIGSKNIDARLAAKVEEFKKLSK